MEGVELLEKKELDLAQLGSSPTVIGLSPPRSLPYEVVYVAYTFWEAEALLVSHKIRTAKVFFVCEFHGSFP